MSYINVLAGRVLGFWALVPAEMSDPSPLAGLMRWGVALSPLVWEWEQRAWEKRTVSIQLRTC